MEQNRELMKKTGAQQQTIQKLGWTLAEYRQSMIALQSEVAAVRAATAKMAMLVKESEADLDDLAGNAATADDEESGTVSSDTWEWGETSGEFIGSVGVSGVSQSWAFKGVQRIFERFDTNRDGVLDVEEINELQV